MRRRACDQSGTPRLCGRRGDEVVDLTVAAPDVPRDMPGRLALGEPGLQVVKAAAEKAPTGSVVAARGLKHCPPVWNPGKIICVGLNYADHASEAALEQPTYPVPFLRLSTTLVGIGQPLVVPLCSQPSDSGGEMVVGNCKPGRYHLRNSVE